MDAIQGDISFDNVSFTYEDSGIEALKNINLTIKKGEKIAILGTTGSGKTTLLDLILRMYDTTGGRIKIDHKNIENINTSKLRESIAYVPQDVFLFSDTIESNILFSQRDKQKSAQELARQAAIGNEIEQFEKGYNTLVGERGVTLSGGQKQRISIARALGANPKILLMDDCLSAVDANTEKEIEENLSIATKNTTVIIVTHRILSNFDFDQIVVLHQGEIKEMGKHDELMEKKGMYYNLNLLQRNDNKN
jgi:ATP-binding cassette subfamily B protein